MTSILENLPAVGAALEAVYKDLHAHPELAFNENRTAGIVAGQLAELGFEVLTGIGGTGVVGVIRNGEGPTVLLRADMDGLPVLEETGLDYASTDHAVDADGLEVPVMHACGHDMHVACLLGAAELLARHRDNWSGTLVVLFQPAEEQGSGAQGMVDDGLYDLVPKPDIVLGQHVGPAPAGLVGLHAGPAFAAADGLEVRMFGRGGHSSRPETVIDPIVMAASTVVRLQTVVSREIAPADSAVVTVGQFVAGTKKNITPDDAFLGITVRSYTETVRARVLDAVHRIIRSEAQASGAEREPEIITTDSFPAVVNDPAASARALSAFTAAFGANRVLDPGAVSGSEDVGALSTAAGAPIVYWILGGADQQTYAAAVAAGRVDQDIPSNHSPRFAPVVQPTLNTGIEALVAGALEWLSPAK
jgi:amidohydrolase